MVPAASWSIEMDIDAMQFGDGEGLDIITRAIMADGRRPTGKWSTGWIVGTGLEGEPYIMHCDIREDGKDWLGVRYMATPIGGGTERKVSMVYGTYEDAADEARARCRNEAARWNALARSFETFKR
jgi:hypothetical protein